MDADPLPLVTEAALAKKLGVSRDLLEKIRAGLAQGADWQINERGAYCYTPGGVEKVAQALATPPPLPDAASEKKDAPAAAYVRRAARFNPRIIFATRAEDGTGAELAVRVRDARCFVPRQRIEIVAADGGTWRLAGPQPRTRGKLRLPRA